VLRRFLWLEAVASAERGVRLHKCVAQPACLSIARDRAVFEAEHQAEGTGGMGRFPDANLKPTPWLDWGGVRLPPVVLLSRWSLVDEDDAVGLAVGYQRSGDNDLVAGPVGSHN
jgi:hypothetical protein